MPDEDEDGRTSKFRQPAARRGAPESEKSVAKGPPRMAIPIEQLPIVKTGGLSLRELAAQQAAARAAGIPQRNTGGQKVQVSPEATMPPAPRPDAIPTQVPVPPPAPMRRSGYAGGPPDDALPDVPGVSPASNPESPGSVPRQTATTTVGGKRETMTPETPGRYEMKREFGRGGQSSVWLALDRHIGRDVAFKQLLPQNSDPRAGASKQVVTAMSVRFLREARITGQLEHPSIVPVYELGKRLDGSFYYTQKLVRGRTFTDALKLCKTLPERLAMLGHFVDLCQAIAYAHKRGVIHRDIKPDNVMVGEFGETVVLDWGLAKQLGAKDAVDEEEELARTQEGDIMGTPAYMSPEQAQGRKREVDAQSDVWSLGAVLFEIITGRAPFVGRNLMTMILAVAKDPIPEPKSLEPAVPPELAAIAMKALTRDRAQRYSSAQEIIRDVEAWQTGGKVQVYRYTPWGTAARWLRKNRAIAITAASVILALTIGAVRVSLENKVARKNLAQALLEKADASSRALEWGKAAVYAAAAREEDDTAEARFRAAHTGPVELEPLLRVQLPGPIDRLALSPDGQTLAVAITGLGLHLVSPKGEDLRTLETPPETINFLTFSPDGTLLAAAVGSALIVFNATSGEPVTTIDEPGRVEQLAFAPDGNRLAAAEGKSVRVYEVASWKQLAQLDGHTAQVRAVAFAPDQSGLASSGDDGTIRFWSPVPVRPAQKLDMKLVRGPGHAQVTRLAFAPAGRVLIPSSSDGTVRFFDLDNGNQQARVATNQAAVLDLAAAGTGLIAALGQDNSVVLLDALTQTEVAHLEGDDASTAVALSADAGRLASANRDGKLRLWKVTPGARTYGFEAAAGFGPALSLTFSPSGKQVAAGDASGHIQLWETSSGKKTGALSLPQGPVGALAWSPSGAFLAAAGNDEVVSLFDIANSQRTTFEGHQGSVRALAFSPDGKTLASVGQDGQIHLWDPQSGAQKGLIAASTSPLNAVTFSRDGILIGAAGEDKVAHVFDARSRKALRKLDPAPDVIFTLAFSPHDTLLATAGRDQAVRTFRLATGKLRSVWNGHGARIHAIAFAPDGEILASASADGTLRLWDVGTGRQVLKLDRPPAPRALAFSPDGRLLATAGEKPPVQIVELDDRSSLLPPKAELARQLELHKLRFDGILLVDDLQALQAKAWKAVPVASGEGSAEGAAEPQ